VTRAILFLGVESNISKHNVFQLKAPLETTNCRVRRPPATVGRYDFVTHFRSLH